MYYLVQAIEEEPPYALLHQLAEAIAEQPGLVLADGLYQLHHMHGILQVPEKAEADRLFQRFTALGFDCFVMDRLLALPPAEELHFDHPTLDEPVELVVAARLEATIQHRHREFNPLAVQVAYPRIIVPSSGWQERVEEERQVTYGLDLLARSRRWHSARSSPRPAQEFLAKVEFPGALLSQGAQALAAGRHDPPTFTTPRDYEAYVTWLYQVRFAPR